MNENTMRLRKKQPGGRPSGPVHKTAWGAANPAGTTLADKYKWRRN
jgi:hypothetical protein